MEKERQQAEEKQLQYVEFLQKYGKLNYTDRRILFPQLAKLKDVWFESLLRYKRSVDKEEKKISLKRPLKGSSQAGLATPFRGVHLHTAPLIH